MKKIIKTNDATKGGEFVGESHQGENGGMRAIVVDNGKQPILVEGSEVIINKKSVNSKKEITVKGTPKEILSTINQLDNNGVAIGDEEAEIIDIYKLGGKVSHEKHLYLGKEGGSNVGGKSSFEIARKLHEKGISSEFIRKNTGWFLNKFDKLWRYEISDRDAKIDLNKITETIEKVISLKEEISVPLRDIYTNAELSKAYGKNIEELPFIFYYNEKDQVLGGVTTILLAEKVFIKFNVYEFLQGNVGKVESTVTKRSKLFISFTTHELQHAIQVREGLSAGGSLAREYRELVRREQVGNDNVAIGNARKNILLENARLNYLNHLGEIEARDSDARKFYDKETRIEIPPYSFIDFNNNEVIVVPETKIKFKDGESVVEFENIKLFNKWFINWYKSISKDMNISFSIPNELQPYKDKNTLILDVFEKKNQSIDAKKYFQEIIDKADEFDITLYLEPSPKHTFFIDNEEKKDKITKEYLITYYKNFRFIENNDNYSMKRIPKTFKTGGKVPNFSNMSKSEIKEFYDSPEGKKLDAETYAEWSKLVNMSKSELEDFYDSEEGKQAGLKQKEADEQGINSGRESARWIMKMKDIPYTEWSSDMWRWAKKQISFIKRMTGVNGSLRDENGKPTRKLLALKIWGNNPEKFEIGGELKNINYMNTVGKQLSLMDDDTNEDYQTIDIFQGTEIETFAKGGGIGENQASFSIRDVNNWDEVPVRWKNTPKINKINYKVDPKDKGLNDLMSKIVGNDELRPVFSGINFDENGATSTDAHKLLSIPAETEFRGVYRTLKSIEKTKGTDLIDVKYPNYQAVIPREFSYVHQVDLYKLLQYCKVALNYANRTTYQIALKVSEEMNIGLNTKFTIDILTSFIKMGYDKAYLHFSEPSRAVIVSNDKNPTLGKSTIGLIMPVMLSSSVLGAMDIDFGLYLKPYFDFEKNQILNSDGSVADFKMNYGEDDVFTKEIVDIIKSITPSNSKVYILENFIVKDKTIRVTDLEDAVEIKGIDVPNGIYKIENDAVIQSSLDADNIDDYPKIGIIEDFETIKINKYFFKWAIEKTKNYVGKDDLRPVMTGINIQKKGDLLSITSTDAHLLATIDSAKYIKLNGVENDFSITVTPKNLFEAIKLMDSEEIEIAFTKDRYSDGGLKGSITVKFICDDIVYTTLSIEGKYPNYRAVIPYNNPKSLLMNMKDIKSIVNSVEVKSFISKNKKEADLIKIYGSELDGNINISIQATKGGYKQETQILGDKFLGKIGYDYDYETTNGNTCSLIMPVMKNEGLENNVFTFNAVLFGKFLDNLDGDILELGFSEPSRAYIVGERNLFYTESKIKVKSKVKKQISKGIKVEEEHRDTLEEIASGKISVDEAIEKTVQDHLAENPEYYEDLAKMESENEESIPDLIEGLKVLLEYAEGEEKTELENTIEGLKLLLDDESFELGGGINDEVELDFYVVRFDTDDYSNIELITTDFDKAKDEYKSASMGDFGDGDFTVSLDKKTDKYKFVYELDEDESVDDYPIEDYYEDSYFYELIEEGEFDNLENRNIEAINESSESLLDKVQEWAKNKYGNYKYNTINVYPDDNEDEDYIGVIQLRIADHSQNENNLPYGIDRSLSVVIANKDATRGRFQQNKPQIYFSGDDSFEDVISEIEGKIEELKEDILAIKFAKGGEVLWATKIGEPDYNEQLITENSSQIENAKKWAMENGFDRIRVSKIDMSSKPNFTQGFKKYAEGGEFRMATGGKIVFKPITTPL